MNANIKSWYDQYAQDVLTLSQQMFDHPEIGLKEYLACAKTADFMRAQGFEVSELDAENKGGAPNTVIAKYGSGKPIIGILGEFDALGGLGQQAVPHRAPLNGPGHGCGHNLMGAGCAGAAAALKATMQAESLPGTVVYYGCPAEETVTGKVLMARDGHFNDLDMCICWHPGGGQVGVLEAIMLASTNLLFTFHGKTAHAAANPHMGRSALDAAELMNIGVQYLREHVTDDVRMHYAYTAAGEAPNIVPDYAQLNYFIRAASRIADDEVVAKVKDIAEGAAKMTGTTVEWTLVSQVYETFMNDTINKLLYDAAVKIPDPVWDEADHAFAATLYQNVTGSQPKGALLRTGVAPVTGKYMVVPGSSDVSDVSHIVPTATLGGGGMIEGLPVHHWSVVACAGSPIGHKAELFAGKALAQCGYDALKNPTVIDGMWAEFREKRKDMAPYQPIEL